MKISKISRTEKEYITEGIEQNLRQDGRERFDYRGFILETGIVSQTAGSARVRLANTDVLVGIKVEIGEPDPDFPDEGHLEVHVECSPSMSPEFEGRGGDEVNTQLSAILRNNLKNSSAIDWKSLCITEGQKCWVIYIDALVLDSSGNLFDAISIATKAALFNTKIPKIEVLKLDDGTTQIEVSDDPSDFSRLNTKNVPICITFAKIGKWYVVDPCVEEELCMSSRLTIAVNSKGNINAIHKGGFTAGISPSEINKMLRSAKTIGLGILKRIDEMLEIEEKNENVPKIGFFR